MAFSYQPAKDREGKKGEVLGFVSGSASFTDLHAMLHLFIKLKPFLQGIMQASILTRKIYQQQLFCARQQHI